MEKDEYQEELCERIRNGTNEVADELQCEILEREVMPDHVHMLCEVEPQFGIHRFVKQVRT